MDEKKEIYIWLKTDTKDCHQNYSERFDKLTEEISWSTHHSNQKMARLI